MVVDRRQGLVETLIRLRVSEHPDSTWLKFKDQRITWGQTLSNCQRFANGLVELGVTPSDALGVICSNRPEFLWAHFGAGFIGATSIPINTSQRGNALEHIFNDAKVRWVVGEWNILEQLGSEIASCPHLDGIVAIDPPKYPTLNETRIVTFESLMCAQDSEPQVEVLSSPPAAGMLYTSGTTGPPKGVVSTKADPGGLLEILNALEVAAGETMYCALPLFHGNALLISTLGSMVLDAQLGLSERFSVSHFFDELKLYEAVEFNALGAIVSILMSRPPSSKDRDHQVRTVLSAGCPDHLWQDFEKRFGVKLVEFYGMVDAPGLLLNRDSVVGSMGKPVGGSEFALQSPNGNILGPGKIGELVFRTPLGKSTSYHNNQEATEEAWRDGWFHTGDLAETNPDGYYFFRGRMKESIRRRGENISPWEIESVVSTHPNVIECAAHAVPSSLGEDEVKLCVVLREPRSTSQQEIYDHCVGKMANYCLPRFIEVVEELPKTSTLKISYKDLRSRPLTDDTWEHDKEGTG